MDFWDFLRGLLVVILTGTALSGLAALNAGSRAASRAGEARAIRPNRAVYLGLAIGGLALTALMAYNAYASYMTFRYGQLLWLVPATLIFALMAWSAAAPVFLPVYTVTWNDEGLTGPSSNWCPPFGPGRATVAFEDIREVGTDWADSFFVQDSAGQQVKFSYLHKGYPQLLDAIADARPELFPQEEDWDDPDG